MAHELVRKLRRLKPHLGKGRWGVACLALIAVSYGLPHILVYMVPASWGLDQESHLRWSGGILQLAGIVTVAIGLSKTRKLFGLPNLGSSVCEWWKGVFAVIAGQGGEERADKVTAAIMSRSHLVAHAGPPNVPEDATLRERVEWLEERYAILRKDVRDLKNGTGKRIKEVQEQLADEAKARKTGDQKNEKLIAEASIGGLHLETVGVLWLAVGVALATFPEALSALSFLPPAG